MSTLIITIDMDNAAFTYVTNDETNGEPNVGPEVARILRKLAGKVQDETWPHNLDGLTVNDINGHAVARTEVPA